MSAASNYSTELLRNVHEGLPNPEAEGETVLVTGDYEYWHYACDGFNDQGWGCGYRTLQTIASWVRANTSTETEIKPTVPTLPEIQNILVAIEDKQKTFIGSKLWIGSFEICLVLDHRYDVRSRIIFVDKGRELLKHTKLIKEHFQESRCPIMMGGDKDCSSKGIVGIHVAPKNTYLLVVDPHFVGHPKSAKKLQKNNWVKWQKLDDFMDSSFYNLCLPLIENKQANLEGEDEG